ncbi:MAG: AEC family transporter [Bernardetiaceae bacterium]
MSNFLLIGLCVLGGILCRRIPGFPKDAHLGLNAFLIYVSLPAISLLYVPALSLRLEMLYPFVSGLLVMGGSLAFFGLLRGQFDRLTVGCLMLVCGLGNTSFVGFPITETLYGSAGLQYAIFADQSAFLMLALVGISIAAVYSGNRLRVSQVLGRILRFPPFWAFVVGLLMAVSGLRVPDLLDPVLRQLGGTLTPLALFSVGLQFKIGFQSLPWKALGLGLAYKLVLAPLLVWGLYVWLAPAGGLAIQVSVLESGMPPMVTASIVATTYKLNPTLANLLVGVGLILAVPTLYGWWLWL